MVGGVITPVVTDTLNHTGNYAALLGRQGFAFTPATNLSNTSDESRRPRLVVSRDGAVHVVWFDGLPGEPEVFYARRAGDGTWSSPQNISNNSGGSWDPQLVVDEGGTLHLVWQDTTPGNSAIFYAKRSSEGTWSSPHNISTSSAWAVLPQLAVDGGQTVHVVWEDYGLWYKSDVFYATRSGNGTWSSPQNISQELGESERPQLAVDGDGAVHLVWQDYSPENYDIFYAKRSSNGTWSSSQNISNNSGGSYVPQLAVDGGGTVHVVWQDTTPGFSDIFYARRSSDGTWSSPRNISSNSGASWYPQLALDGGGTVHVVWHDDTPGSSDVFYARRSSDGTWSSPQNISNNPGSSEGPQLAVNSDGTVHVVWMDTTPGNYDIFHTKRSSEGTWSSPQNISNNSGWSESPHLVVDVSETVHVVWSDNAEIFYARPDPVDQTGDSNIAQAVTVPVTVSTPVLSFFYQLVGVSTTSGSWFNVQVDNSITATTLFSTTATTSDWTHRWFDLTPWAGQAITLTFNLHQTVGDPVRQVYLDEITLGSAYPDLWASKGGPAARPGEQVVYTIAYGNRGGAAASGVRITDTLPVDLSFVDASPPPIIATPPLVWDVGDLPARSGPFTIVVTATVAPTVMMGSTVTNTVASIATSPELETFNNATQAPIFIGYRLYLPVAMKGHLW